MIKHIKHDSIPSVETFEILSDGECDSSDNNTLCKDAKTSSNCGVAPSTGKCVRCNQKDPLESQNRVMENADPFPSELVQLLDGFRASKVTRSLLLGSWIYKIDFLILQWIWPGMRYWFLKGKSELEGFCIVKCIQ